MPPKTWDDEEESSSDDSSSAGPAPQRALPVRRNKFDDEEEEDSDVLDSWDADDSDEEAEKEKAKKEAEAKAAKAKAEAAAALKKKKGLRISDKMAERARAQEAAEEEEGETPAERKARLLRNQQESDMQIAADMLGQAAPVGAKTAPVRKSAARIRATVVEVDPADPTKTVDLSKLKAMNPTTKADFEAFRATLKELVLANKTKPHYEFLVQNLTKDFHEVLNSTQIKKSNSALVALANDKLREEKAAEKGGKKSKAKAKATLSMGRANQIDTGTYDDFGDDDFM